MPGAAKGELRALLAEGECFAGQSVMSGPSGELLGKIEPGILPAPRLSSACSRSPVVLCATVAFVESGLCPLELLGGQQPGFVVGNKLLQIRRIVRGTWSCR